MTALGVADSETVCTSPTRAERRTKKSGSGVEFVDYREYAAGDDLRYVDWKAYARLERLFVKLFVAEEDLLLQSPLPEAGIFGIAHHVGIERGGAAAGHQPQHAVPNSWQSQGTRRGSTSETRRIG